MSQNICFHIPTRPYSPIDAHNRAASARGGARWAQLTSNADYNGHHVTLAWNDYRGYYVAEYYWAGRVVLARGSFAECLKAVVAEYNRGALGSSVGVTIPAHDVEALAVARAEPLLVEGSFWVWEAPGVPVSPSFWTWRHDVGVQSVRDACLPRSRVLIFDWELCQAAENREAYDAALRAKYGHTHQ